MSKRIDVGKLRGTYYNNDKDSYLETTSLSDMKKTMSDDVENLLSDGEYNSFDETEETVVAFIKNMPISDYNNLSDETSRQLSKYEATDNLLKVYIVFKDVISLTSTILIYCDYFSLKYEKLIKDLPNGVKELLYNELKKYTRKPYLLNRVFCCSIDENTKKLF